VLLDVSKYPYLTAELYSRGYSDADVIKVIGGNLLRVFKMVESVASGIKEGPIEVVIPNSYVANDTCRTDWL
jgi:hypothetical protein